MAVLPCTTLMSVPWYCILLGCHISWQMLHFGVVFWSSAKWCGHFSFPHAVHSVLHGLMPILFLEHVVDSCCRFQRFRPSVSGGYCVFRWWSSISLSCVSCMISSWSAGVCCMFHFLVIYFAVLSHRSAPSLYMAPVTNDLWGNFLSPLLFSKSCVCVCVVTVCG